MMQRFDYSIEERKSLTIIPASRYIDYSGLTGPQTLGKDNIHYLKADMPMALIFEESPVQAVTSMSSAIYPCSRLPTW